MATKLPRLNVVMEPYVYQAIALLSKSQGLSLSLVARDLLRDALTLHEDAYWVREAGKREAGFSKAKAIPHRKAWKS